MSPVCALVVPCKEKKKRRLDQLRASGQGLYIVNT